MPGNLRKRPGESRESPGIIPGQSRENFVYVFSCLLVFSSPTLSRGRRAGGPRDFFQTLGGVSDLEGPRDSCKWSSGSQNMHVFIPRRSRYLSLSWSRRTSKCQCGSSAIGQALSVLKLHFLQWQLTSPICSPTIRLMLPPPTPKSAHLTF